MKVLGQFLLLLVVAWAPGTSAQQAQETPALPSVELPPELERVLVDYETAWKARDEEALAGLFAEDGFVLSGGKPPVHGRENIRRHYENSGGPLALRALAYATEGTVGYIIGGFSVQAGDPDIGKFTLTLVKNDAGRWMIMSDMDNGNGRGGADPADSIRAASRAFSSAYVSGDMTAIRHLYTEDAVLLPPGGEIRGRSDIVRYFGPRPDRKNVSHSMDSSELKISGNRAVDVGTWNNTWVPDGSEQRSASGPYLVVWKRGADGSWKIEYDMWHRP